MTVIIYDADLHFSPLEYFVAAPLTNGSSLSFALIVQATNLIFIYHNN